MSIYATLENHIEALHTLYERNLEIVRSLQRTLSEDILPGLVDEQELDESDEEKSRNYLKETPSIFRTLKRHKFTTSFALEALRTTLSWRLIHIPPLHAAPPSQFLHCLPPSARDPFDRPVIVLQLAGVSESTEDLRTVLLRNMELLRLHLFELNRTQNEEEPGFRPILQYVALVDIKGISLNSVQNIDLLGWYMNELLPRFPGMLASCFILNYSWAHTGLWNLAKRALPESALSKVFFPTEPELLGYFSPASVPRDYGGDLPYLSELDDPLHALIRTSSNASRQHCCLLKTNIGVPQLPPTQSPTQSPTHSPTQSLALSNSPTTTAISPTSLFNPFFGYPVTYSSSCSHSIPTLQHGRRRKRDLVRTLVQLWWIRWRKQITYTGFCLLVTLSMVLLVRKGGSAVLRRWKWRLGSLPALSLMLGSVELTDSVGAAFSAVLQ